VRRWGGDEARATCEGHLLKTLATSGATSLRQRSLPATCGRPHHKKHDRTDRQHSRQQPTAANPFFGMSACIPPVFESPLCSTVWGSVFVEVSGRKPSTTYGNAPRAPSTSVSPSSVTLNSLGMPTVTPSSGPDEGGAAAAARRPEANPPSPPPLLSEGMQVESFGSGPAMTSSTMALSRTVRARMPGVSWKERGRKGGGTGR